MASFPSLRPVLVVSLLCLLGLLQEASSFGSGAPGSQQICEGMMPKHGVEAQTSKSPYSSKVSKVSAMGGDTLKFTLSAPDGENLKGFLVMVKKQGDPKKAYGSFLSTSPDAKALNCFDKPNSAMTHTSNVNKKTVTLEWVAPNDGDLEGLELVVTYVKKADTIWQAVPHTEKLSIKKNLNAVAVTPEKRISDSLRQKLTSAYTTEGKGYIGMPSGCVQAFKDSQNAETPKTCAVLGTWEVKGERYEYTIVGNLAGTSGYAALGFSNDDKMGDDSVAACFMDQGNPKIERFVNPNGQTTSDGHSNRNLGISSKRTETEDGFIFCHFEQSDHAIDGKIDVQMKEPYYYLVAHGSNTNPPNSLVYHNTRLVTDTKVSVFDTEEAGTASDSRVLYQLHGAFMIVAWLLCASTGMFTARYYKLTNTDMTPFGKAFWFAIHVSCMFTTVFLTICGIIFIVIKKGGYYPKNGDDIMWHPVLGTILFGLALFQVLIAFFRPHPGTSKRPIFNWVHWIVGNSAHIIGIACIFLANDLKAANLEKDEYMFIMLGAVLFHIVMHLVMSFHTLWADKQMDSRSKRAVVPGPMKPNGLSTEAPGTGFRTALLYLYILGLGGCSIALLYYVCRPLETTLAPQQ